MDYKLCTVAFIIFMLYTEHIGYTCYAMQFDMEAENMTHFGLKIHERARNKKTIHMYALDVLFTEICIQSPNTSVEIENVVYCNDGGSDQIQISLGNKILGVFQTKAIYNFGKDWFKFRWSGKLSVGVIDTGRHKLSIQVLEADTYGVEIESIRIRIDNGQTEDTFKCEVFCFDEINFEDTFPKLVSEQGKVQQKSVKTTCAEEDNINIPVFHPSVSKYIISASLPKYPSFSNSRKADWSNCEKGSEFWKFTNVRLKDKSVIKTETAQMSFYANKEVNATNNSIGAISIDFALKGPSTGSTDADIGMLVLIKGFRYTEPVTLKFQYFGRYNKWSQSQVFTLKNNQESATFTTPDFVFKEGSHNIIRIELSGDEAFAGDMSIDEIAMITRAVKKDNSTLLFDDGITIMESMKTDMWWQINQTMSITMLSNGLTYDETNYFRIYKKVPWHNSFCQIFVLYQDGNVRLLPLIPHGLDWIPFGSSILLGQSDPSLARPMALIKHLDVDPHSLEIKIHYFDGGSINLQIKVTYTDTQLIISDSTYARDMSLFPFITFRSMWITDGNGDVDHITVGGGENNTETHGIIDDWQLLRGNFFAFYRKCISNHNTLSPDLRLKILA